MKIGIHHSEGSFSQRWITYCEKNRIDYKIVNCYDSDIVDQLADCKALMWHHNHGNFKDVLFAKGLLFSLEHANIATFPDFKTGWHFDDKVGQKYLLESINAPVISSHIFYDKKEAKAWANNTTYPKVFKLRGGAGSANVKLVKNKIEALSLITTAFGRGFSQFDRVGHLKERIRKWKIGADSFIGVLKAVRRLFIGTRLARTLGRERGYAYFQDFIPDNTFDIRVVVIGNKAFALKRMTRNGDFRASGSGMISYKKEEIDTQCIKSAFDVNRLLLSKCIAFDFVFDGNNNPLIVELSYGFTVKPYDLCQGYWDDALCWHEGKFNPQEWMVENLLEEIKIKQ